MSSPGLKAKHSHLNSSGLRISLAFVLAIVAVVSGFLLNWNSSIALAAGSRVPPAQEADAAENIAPDSAISAKEQDAPPSRAPNSGCGGAVSEQSAGTVSVGCPKVWRSDRVFSVLDGIMRDVDSMTVRALEGLDANAANQAVIETIQTSFDLTAKYDQAAAISNSFALEKLKAARGAEISAYKADADFRQKLTKQRNDLTLQLLDAQSKERQQAQSGASAEEIGKTQQLETSLQDQIKTINDTLNTNPPSIADASLESTASAAIPEQTHATLDTMPQEFKNALAELIKKPTFPPAIAMDNVIDLLHQRIAREFAVIYDDLMRDGDNYDVYLVQFDTSINPKLDTHDRGVRVQLTLPVCEKQDDPLAQQKYPLAYELYPTAAAYNIMQGFNQTSHTGISGIVQTIFGLGLQASFKRDHSSLRSGLSQSIYASGFGAGQNTFGWDFAPAPYESKLAPGLRTTYAIMRVPKGCQSPLHTFLKVDWPMRDRRYPGWNPAHWFRSDKKKPVQWGPWIEVPQDHPLRLTHVSYVPADTGEKGTGDIAAQKTAASGNAAAADSAPGGGGAAIAKPSPAVIQVRFRNPIDPNLIITANDQILRRVRDVRGRGLYSDATTALHLAGNTEETKTLSTSRFGLLESDTLGEDTWFQADSRTVLLNVGRKTAGTDRFPVIRIIDPSSGGGGSELTTLAREADDVRIGEWFFTQPATLTSSSFQPLFAKPYNPGPFRVFIQKVIRSNDRLSTLELRLVSYATRGPHRPIYLHDQAQVVLEADVTDPKDRYAIPENIRSESPTEDQALRLNPNWALECRQDRGALVCSAPLEEMREFCSSPQSKADAVCLKKWQKGCANPPSRATHDLSCLTNLKVWLDQAPYYGRPGLWGDADLRVRPRQSIVPWENLQADHQDLIARGQYEIKEERVDAQRPALGYAWVADLELVDRKGFYEIPEFSDLQKTITDEIKAAIASENKPRQQRGVKAERPGEKAEQSVQRYFSTTDNFCGGKAFQVVSTPRGICVMVPYAFFSVLPQRLHLQSKDKPDSMIELPNLRDQLIPHDLKIVSQDKNVYQLQGDSARAVDKVVLSAKNHKPCTLTPITRSYNVLQIDITPCEPEEGLQFAIQLGLGDGQLDAYVDLFQTDKTGLESQQVIAIPAKPKTGNPPKPEPSARTSTNVHGTMTATASVGANPSASATVTSTINSAAQNPPAANTTQHAGSASPAKTPPNTAAAPNTQAAAATTQTPQAGKTPTPPPNPASTKTPTSPPSAADAGAPADRKKKK